MFTYVCLSCECSLVCVSLCLKLKELNHDNIKPFIGACVEPGHICYLMQCCSRGTLQVTFKCDQACVPLRHLYCIDSRKTMTGH